MHADFRFKVTPSKVLNLMLMRDYFFRSCLRAADRVLILLFPRMTCSRVNYIKFRKKVGLENKQRGQSKRLDFESHACKTLNPARHDPT